MTTQKAIMLLEQLQKEYDRKIENVYNSYCIYPNPDDQRDYYKYGEIVDAIKMGIIGISAFEYKSTDSSKVITQ